MYPTYLSADPLIDQGEKCRFVFSLLFKAVLSIGTSMISLQSNTKTTGSGHCPALSVDWIIALSVSNSLLDLVMKIAREGAIGSRQALNEVHENNALVPSADHSDETTLLVINDNDPRGDQPVQDLKYKVSRGILVICAIQIGFAFGTSLLKAVNFLDDQRDQPGCHAFGGMSQADFLCTWLAVCSLTTVVNFVIFLRYRLDILRESNTVEARAKDHPFYEMSAQRQAFFVTITAFKFAQVFFSVTYYWLRFAEFIQRNGQAGLDCPEADNHAAVAAALGVMAVVGLVPAEVRQTAKKVKELKTDSLKEVSYPLLAINLIIVTLGAYSFSNNMVPKVVGMWQDLSGDTSDSKPSCFLDLMPAWQAFAIFTVMADGVYSLATHAFTSVTSVPQPARLAPQPDGPNPLVTPGMGSSQV
jgi:hypothetical protein